VQAAISAATDRTSRREGCTIDDRAEYDPSDQ